MTKIIALHSFRGGTGKSNMVANLATILANQGQRIAIVDTDIQSPGIHVLFNLNEDAVKLSLNDYLWERCTLQDATYEVTPAAIASNNGHIFLVPCSIKLGEIARILKEGYDVLRLTKGLQRFCEDLQLDYLLLDTHPGMNEETLLSIAISQELMILLRPDRQDFQGTTVALEIAHKLNAPKISLVVNKLLSKYSPDDVKEQIAQIFQVPVMGVFPMAEAMIDLGSKGIFVLEYPQHPYTDAIKRVAAIVQLN